jgi:hypothetical protein
MHRYETAFEIQAHFSHKKCGKINPHIVKATTQSEILFPIFYFLIQYGIKRDKSFPKIADRFRDNFHGG